MAQDLSPALDRVTALMNGRGLMAAEKLLLSLIALLGIASVLLTFILSRDVQWSGFSVGLVATVLLIAVGVYARVAKSAYRLANCAIGIGLFMGFVAFSSIFIFALLPLSNPMIDLELMAVDGYLGYDWKGFAEALAAWPGLNWGLSLLYGSALLQVALTIVILGALRREVAMHRFILVGMVSLTIAVGIWVVWPSIGPPGYSIVDPALRERVGLIANPDFGAHLISLIKVGPEMIAPEVIIGVVSFPSYHIVMSLMVLLYTRGTFAALPAWLAFFGMIPATLVHGGHHLIDLLAGGLLFMLCAWIASRLIPDRAASGDGHLPDQ